jgi:hypothetical protein
VEFWFEAVRRAIVVAPLEFVRGPVRGAAVASLWVWVLEPGARALKMTPAVMARITFADAVSDSSSVMAPVKFTISGFDNFLNRAASTRTVVAVSLTLRPGIAGQGHNKTHQYDTDDNDLFLHGLPPCFQD